MNLFIHQIFVWFWNYKHNLTFIWVFKKKSHGWYSNKFEYSNILKNKKKYIYSVWHSAQCINIPPGTTGSRASLLSPTRRTTWRGSTNLRPEGQERDWNLEGRKDHCLCICKHNNHKDKLFIEPIIWCSNKKKV